MFASALVFADHPQLLGLGDGTHAAVDLQFGKDIFLMDPKSI
ncbi:MULTISPECIES: hypothetical protein [Paenibacillus]